MTGQGILNWFPWRKTGLFQNPHQPIQQCGDSDLSDETGELCWPAISGPSTQIMYNVCTKINCFWAIYTHKQKYRFLITQRFYWYEIIVQICFQVQIVFVIEFPVAIPKCQKNRIYFHTKICFSDFFVLNKIWSCSN